MYCVGAEKLHFYEVHVDCFYILKKKNNSTQSLVFIHNYIQYIGKCTLLFSRDVTQTLIMYVSQSTKITSAMNEKFQQLQPTFSIATSCLGLKV